MIAGTFILTAPPVAGCDGGWVRRPGSNSCYNFVTSKSLTWSSAQGLCKDMGGGLAIVETEEEIVWLRGYRSYHAELRQSTFWIGGYRKDGKWWWKGDLTDFPMVVTDWAKGQPDSAAQNCVSLFPAITSGDAATVWFRFDNDECTDSWDFICEKKDD